MFQKSVELYDAFYRAQGKDYAAESARVRELIEARSPGARTLLDVGCGTGGHLAHLQDRFDCTGIDIEPGFLEIAEQRLADDVVLAPADMVELDLGTRFDVVISLFSSIGYVRTLDRLSTAAERFAQHLNPGGAIIVEPWVTPDRWPGGERAYLTVADDDVQAVRMTTTTLDGSVEVLSVHYMFLGDRGVEYQVERHEIGLFSFREYATAFEQAGFDVEVDEEGLTGRGLLLGTLR